MEKNINNIEISNATASCIAALRALNSVRENYRQALMEICTEDQEAENRYNSDETAFVNVEKILAKVLHTSILGHVEIGGAMI